MTSRFGDGGSVGSRIKDERAGVGVAAAGAAVGAHGAAQLRRGSRDTDSYLREYIARNPDAAKDLQGLPRWKNPKGDMPDSGPRSRFEAMKLSALMDPNGTQRASDIGSRLTSGKARAISGAGVAAAGLGGVALSQRAKQKNRPSGDFDAA